jgi:hypothetical protein
MNRTAWRAVMPCMEILHSARPCAKSAEQTAATVRAVFSIDCSTAPSKTGRPTYEETGASSPTASRTCRII